VRGWLKDFGADKITLAIDVLPTKAKGFSSEVASGSREENPTYEELGFDAALHGWVEGSGISLWDVLDYYPEGVAKRLLVTDVSRDGMLMGPNMALMQALKDKRPDLEIMASGGVRSVDDLRELHAMGIYGAIVGKAIYEGIIDLKEALSVS
jgi:phosphoribosylformimino-5-aminoimidazole carboxamide ribotide isomerase